MIDAAAVAAKSADALANPTGAAKQAADDAAAADAAMNAYRANPTEVNRTAALEAARIAEKSAKLGAFGAAKQAADDAAAADAAMNAYRANPTAVNRTAAHEAARIAEKSAMSAALAWNLAHPKTARPGKDGMPTTGFRVFEAFPYTWADGTKSNLPYDPDIKYSWPCGITSNVPYEYSSFSGESVSCPSDQPLPDQSYPWGWRGIDYGFHFGN
jgi:hypothetical protein